MNEYLKHYVNYLRGNKRSENTIKAYVADIEQCLNGIGKSIEAVTIFDLEDWKVGMSNLSSASSARKISAIRCFFKYLADRDVIAKDPAKNLTGVKIKNKIKVVPDGHEIRAMLEVAGNRRNKAIIMTLATTGMRISELESITLEQYKSRMDDAIVITGKGDKQRVIQFAPETIKMIDEYLVCRVDGCDRLFTSNLGNPIGHQCTSDMLKRTAKRAGIENWHDISNHYMRAAFATIKSEAGVPIEVIKDMMGHKSVETSARYIKRTEQRAKASMAVVNF
jgi:integrase/recombinase XerD